MTDHSPVLIDTNVILDVTEQDQTWATWSQNQMVHYHGRLTINPLIYTELCYEAGHIADVDSLLLALDLRFENLPRQALFLTSQAYRRYRNRGGTKTSPLPDFFIGAHAAALGIPILTRDVTRYRTYFPTVDLICP
jgi:predicted nucleic acid-binding protein